MTNAEKIASILAAVQAGNVFNNNLETKINTIITSYPSSNAIMQTYLTQIELQKNDLGKNTSVVINNNIPLMSELGMEPDTTNIVAANFGSISGIGETYLDAIIANPSTLNANLTLIQTMLTAETAALAASFQFALDAATALEVYGMVKNTTVATAAQSIFSDDVLAVKSTNDAENLVKLNLSTAEDSDAVSTDPTHYYDIDPDPVRN